LWPLFGATNQLLAGLAFMVTAFYLWRRNKPVWFVTIPLVIMVILPAWALGWQLFSTETNGATGRPIGWFWNFIAHGEPLLLTVIALLTLVLQVWMVIEAVAMWPRAKGVLEKALPPLQGARNRIESTGGRSC